MTVRVAVVVGGLLTAVAGCGNSNPSSKGISPAAQARAVVEQYYADIEHVNAGAACGLMTASARAEAEGVLRLFPGAQIAHRDRCLWQFRPNLRALAHVHSQSAEPKFPTASPLSPRTASDAAARHRLTERKVGQAKLVGDRAIVSVTVGRGHTDDLLLVKTPAGWRISKLPLRKPIGG